MIAAIVAGPAPFRPVFQPIVRLADRCRHRLRGPHPVRRRRAARRAVRRGGRARLRAGPRGGLPPGRRRRRSRSPGGRVADAQLRPRRFLLSGGLEPILRGASTARRRRDHRAPRRRRLRDAARQRWSRSAPACRLPSTTPGAGFAGLRHLVELRPHVVKLDRGDRARDRRRPRAPVARGGHGPLRAPHRRPPRGRGRRDRPRSRRVAARRWASSFAQGYLFARPAPIEQARRGRPRRLTPARRTPGSAADGRGPSRDRRGRGRILAG